MPSSTSSSSKRIPRAPYLRYGLLFLVVLGGLLAASEFFWRSKGFLPSVVDSRMWWAHHRAQATSSRGKPTLVIVGASRAQLGIDPGILEEEIPGYSVIHLAIDGTPPYEILKDLCLDPNFDGVILCSTTAPGLKPATPGSERRDLTYTQFYREEYFSPTLWRERLDTWIEATLQSRLALLSPILTLHSILKNHGNPDRLYLHMHVDRYRPSFYLDRTTTEQLAEIRDRREPTLDHATLVEGGLDPMIGDDLRQLHEALQSRGGKLVLVRMPTTGNHWERSNVRYPKDRYWDQVTSWSGIPTIHFLDYPELSRYECPDTSHLDATDAPQFTRDLGRILRDLLSIGVT